MKRSDLIWAISDVDEELLAEMEEYSMSKNTKRRPVRLILIAAAIAALLIGSVFALVYYTHSTEALANHWEQLGGTEMQGTMKDEIERKSADIGMTATDQGITITVDSVTVAEGNVYVVLKTQGDPEKYDPDKSLEPEPSAANSSIQNDAYGTVSCDDAYGKDASKENDENWSQEAYHFENLPEGARLGDGNTTMYLTIDKVWMQDSPKSSQGAQATEGNWSFAFLLPKTDNAENKTSDEIVVFDGADELTVSGMTATETDLSFQVVSASDNYQFVGSGVVAELARAAEPDLPSYAAEAKLQDGTMVPTEETTMTISEDGSSDIWTITWAAPVNPSDITAIVFSDGQEDKEIAWTAG